MTLRQSQVNVLSIKKFADICRTTPRTIRFYDQKGLLKPKFIDKWTGYRYYDQEQARDFLRIRFMQNFHIPLNQIALAVKMKTGDSYLAEKLDSLKKQITEQEKEYKFLKKFQELLFAEKELEKVFKKETIGPFNLFVMKVERAHSAKANEYRFKLWKKAAESGIKAEKDIIFYLETDYKPESSREEYAMICKKDYSKAKLALGPEFYFRKFPKTEALTYMYQGPNNYFILLYQKLFEYIFKYKVKLEGPVFDINMENPFIEKSKFDYRTKIVFPV
jgi:DNA-binding transcriptional MerR regulator